MDMLNLGFTGQTYTWKNKHKSNKTLIMEHLDHFLNNYSWLILFPNTSLSSPSYTVRSIPYTPKMPK